MTKDEFKSQVWTHLCQLWPDWKPTPEQGDAWYDLCREKTVNAAMIAVKALWNTDAKTYKTPDHRKFAGIIASFSELRPVSRSQQTFRQLWHGLTRIQQAVIGAEMCRRALIAKRFEKIREREECEVTLNMHEGLIRRYSEREPDAFQQAEHTALAALQSIEAADQRTQT